MQQNHENNIQGDVKNVVGFFSVNLSLRDDRFLAMPETLRFLNPSFASPIIFSSIYQTFTTLLRIMLLRVYFKTCFLSTPYVNDLRGGPRSRSSVSSNLLRSP